VLTARLRGTAAGAKIDRASDVPLYVGKVASPGADDWPWDGIEAAGAHDRDAAVRQDRLHPAARRAALPTGEVHNGMCVVGDCGGMAPAGVQFDFFVGREDRHIQIPTLAASQGGAVCRVEIVGDCAAAHNRGP
jgi:hypothetical protein